MPRLNNKVVHNAYQRSNICKLLVRGDENRLNEKLVTTFRIRGRIFLHSLEQDCGYTLVCWSSSVARSEGHTLDLDILARLNATAVWPNTVSTLFSIRGSRTLEVCGGRTAWERWF